jgi:uncharacterized membrane protein
MRRSVLLAFVLVLLQFAAAAYLYPHMPDQIATHWNLAGEADGYGSKSMGLFLIPVLELVLVPVFLALPRIDPKADREKIMGTYSWFILAFTGYMTYFYGITLAWNLGYHNNFLRLVVPVLGMLFYGLGMLIQNVEMNWFLGIRTPWTLSSEEVWRDTHKLGGKLFKICGVLALGGLFFSGWVALFLVVLPMMLSGIYLMVYSYQRYMQVQRK